MGQLGMLYQVAELAVDRHKEARPKHLDQPLQFLLAGVARDVRLGLVAIVDVRASLKQAVDDAIGRLLVTRDGMRGDQHRVALLDLKRAVVVGCQPVQDRHWLALGSSCHDDHLVGRQAIDVLQAHQHILRDIEIAQLAGNLGVLDHTPAGNGDLAPVLPCDVHHLLDARDQRGKGGDDQPPWRFAHDLVKSIVQYGLRWRRPGLVSVRTV